MNKYEYLLSTLNFSLKLVQTLEGYDLFYKMNITSQNWNNISYGILYLSTCNIFTDISVYILWYMYPN